MASVLAYNLPVAPDKPDTPDTPDNIDTFDAFDATDETDPLLDTLGVEYPFTFIPEKLVAISIIIGII